MDVETVLRQTLSPSEKKRWLSNRNSKMKPEPCLVSSEQLSIASAKKDIMDLLPKKSLSRKERLLALAQKIARLNAEFTNEMFEILSMKED